MTGRKRTRTRSSVIAVVSEVPGAANSRRPLTNLLRRGFVVALPVVVVAASQLLGPRAAWVTTIATAIAIPLVCYLGASRETVLTDPEFVRRLVVFEISLLTVGGLIGSFFRTIGDL